MQSASLNQASKRSAFLVGSLVQAPPGSTPRQGAMVRAIDAKGELVGMALTGPDGGFKLDIEEAGLVKLEGLLEPDGEIDITMPLTTIRGQVVKTELVPAQVRSEAVAQALTGVPDTALVAGSLNLLPPGTVVEEAIPGSAPARRLEASEWLFYVDYQPFERLTHSVEYRFVNGETGDLTVVAAESYPAVNGSPIWDSDFQIFDYTGFDLSDPDALPADFAPPVQPEVVQLPIRPLPPLDLLNREVSASQDSSIRAAGVVDASGVFAILVQGSEGSAFAADPPRVLRFLTRPIGGGPDRTVPLDNVIVIDGTQSDGDQQLIKAINIMRQKVQARRNAGMASTLI
ncbi:MAG: hypothetical protein KC800_27575, partial [Candidatus Eremiobacteraeota bacterium]|nr:hypothetical protein [Candidatus Eremiobacteraeota bacterium]